MSKFTDISFVRRLARSAKPLLPLLVSAALWGCHDPAGVDDLDGGGNEAYGEIVSIQHLKTLYQGYPRYISEDISIRGQLVSSDWSGNFANSMIICDDSGGIEVRVDMEYYYQSYMEGSYVFVRCSGLTLGSYGGSLQLGVYPGDARYECDNIPSRLINSHIISDDNSFYDIYERPIGIGDLDFSMVNTPVKVEGVRFREADAGKPWADPDKEGYSERTLESLSNSLDTLVVRTHAECRFNTALTPTGSGHIRGILQYFNGKYSLKLVDTDYFSMWEWE